MSRRPGHALRLAQHGVERPHCEVTVTGRAAGRLPPPLRGELLQRRLLPGTRTASGSTCGLRFRSPRCREVLEDPGRGDLALWQIDVLARGKVSGALSCGQHLSVSAAARERAPRGAVTVTAPVRPGPTSIVGFTDCRWIVLPAYLGFCFKSWILIFSAGPLHCPWKHPPSQCGPVFGQCGEQAASHTLSGPVGTSLRAWGSWVTSALTIHFNTRFSLAVHSGSCGSDRPFSSLNATH